jgi:hypothetical protein
LEKQKFEKQKKAAALCQLWAERFGTWDVRPPETPKKVLRRFDVLRPPRTVQNESRQSAGLAKNQLFPFSQAGNAPVLHGPKNVAHSYQKLALTSGKLKCSLLGRRQRHLKSL